MTRALSLTQPWASLCVLRSKQLIPQTGDGVAEKEYETRSRGCSWARYMKPETIYIHAAKNFPRWAKDLCESKMFSRILGRHGYDRPEDLPTAGIIGSVNVLGSLPTEAIRDRLSPQELAFGDYDTGRIAIRLAHPRGFDMLFRCKGALGLWTVPAEVERVIVAHGINIPVPAGAVERLFPNA